jgi:hypothetical protein
MPGQCPPFCPNFLTGQTSWPGSCRKKDTADILSPRLPDESREEFLHEAVTVFGHAPSRGSQHGFTKVAEFHKEFPVRGVLEPVRAGAQRLASGVVDPRPDAPGEVEGPADPDGAHGVELVGVVDHPRFRSPGPDPSTAPEAMGPHARGDVPDKRLVGEPRSAEEDGRLARAGPGMTDRPRLLVLPGPADVVQEGGALDNRRIGVRRPRKTTRRPDDANCVVPVMTARIRRQDAPDVLPEAEDGSLILPVRSCHGTLLQSSAPPNLRAPSSLSSR